MSMHDAVLPPHSCTETQLLVAVYNFGTKYTHFPRNCKHYYDNIVNASTFIYKGAI